MPRLSRRSFLASASALAAAAPVPHWQIGAYYFANYHPDARNAKLHGPGWTEWELVKLARPRFPDHQQPKQPLWGHEDESSPVVMQKKIEAAATHGLSHWIFDWYHYNDGPFLQRALEDGYLKASNNHRLQFALMWANHDWLEIQPAKYNTRPEIVFPGAVTRPAFDRITDYIIETYFRHPSYWKLDGAPYFSIYELFRLVDGLGGIPATRDALQSFRRKTRAAGFPDLHLNAVVWGVKILPGEQQIRNGRELLETLGFSSTTSYVWVHHVRLKQFPVTPYEDVARAAAEAWPQLAAEYALPYHPNVTMGWDSSPRTCQSDRFADRGYPFMATLGGNTPEAFKRALLAMSPAGHEALPRKPPRPAPHRQYQRLE
ncbi:MAG: glycoside hydrolase family 99-like domain-containing protein [Acidobacteria bacterium]|nr:glycoside hydrolase family 99-like domain-containing protein [Acidobacteriota bacterium]